jgi:uncharacterized protein YlxW (UPF0749 family)
MRRALYELEPASVVVFAGGLALAMGIGAGPAMYFFAGQDQANFTYSGLMCLVAYIMFSWAQTMMKANQLLTFIDMLKDDLSARKLAGARARSSVRESYISTLTKCAEKIKTLQDEIETLKMELEDVRAQKAIEDGLAKVCSEKGHR